MNVSVYVKATNCVESATELPSVGVACGNKESGVILEVAGKIQPRKGNSKNCVIQ